MRLNKGRTLALRFHTLAELSVDSEFRIIAQRAVRSKKKPALFLGSRGKKRKHSLAYKRNTFGGGRHRDEYVGSLTELLHRKEFYLPAEGRTPSWVARIFSVEPFL